MSRSPVTPETLAAALAARLVHDLSGPASGVASGLELHADPDLPEMKADGLNLAAASSYALVDLLEFCRVAFGATGEPLAADALGKLAQTQFTGKRAALDWSPSAAELSGAQAQALLILAQIAAGGLATVDDIVRLAARPGTPIAGAVLGRALYAGTIAPLEALAAAA